MLSAAQVKALVAQRAPAYNLDPLAVLSVGAQEGLYSTTPGDAGTSFGPWQLHAGGALPASVWAQGANYAQQWAWSPEGVEYALQAMSQVAAGLTGANAINTLVHKFERPREDLRAGEIARASALYNQGGGAMMQDAGGVDIGAPGGTLPDIQGAGAGALGALPGFGGLPSGASQVGALTDPEGFSVNPTTLQRHTYIGQGGSRYWLRNRADGTGTDLVPIGATGQADPTARPIVIPKNALAVMPDGRVVSNTGLGGTAGNTILTPGQTVIGPGGNVLAQNPSAPTQLGRGNVLVGPGGQVLAQNPAMSPEEIALKQQELNQTYQVKLAEAQRQWQADRDDNAYRIAVASLDAWHKNESLRNQRLASAQTAAIQDRAMQQPMMGPRDTVILPGNMVGSAFSGQWGPSYSDTGAWGQVPDVQQGFTDAGGGAGPDSWPTILQPGNYPAIQGQQPTGGQVVPGLTAAGQGQPQALPAGGGGGPYEPAPPISQQQRDLSDPEYPGRRPLDLSGTTRTPEGTVLYPGSVDAAVGIEARDRQARIDSGLGAGGLGPTRTGARSPVRSVVQQHDDGQFWTDTEYSDGSWESEPYGQYLDPNAGAAGDTSWSATGGLTGGGGIYPPGTNGPSWSAPPLVSGSLSGAFPYGMQPPGTDRQPPQAPQPINAPISGGHPYGGMYPPGTERRIPQWPDLSGWGAVWDQVPKAVSRFFPQGAPQSQPSRFSPGGYGGGGGEWDMLGSGQGDPALEQQMLAMGAGPQLGQPPVQPPGGSMSPVPPEAVVGHGNAFGDQVENEVPFHKGEDYQAAAGAPAQAPVNGTVVFVGERGDLGLSVVIQDEAGQTHELNHLSDASVQVGDPVQMGQPVGQVGASGNATGSHLDYRVRGQNGDFTDPAALAGVGDVLGGMPNMEGMPMPMGQEEQMLGAGQGEGWGYGPPHMPANPWQMPTADTSSQSGWANTPVGSGAGEFDPRSYRGRHQVNMFDAQWEPRGGMVPDAYLPWMDDELERLPRVIIDPTQAFGSGGGDPWSFGSGQGDGETVIYYADGGQVIRKTVWGGDESTAVYEDTGMTTGAPDGTASDSAEGLAGYAAGTAAQPTAPTAPTAPSAAPTAPSAAPAATPPATTNPAAAQGARGPARRDVQGGWEFIYDADGRLISYRPAFDPSQINAQGEWGMKSQESAQQAAAELARQRAQAERDVAGISGRAGVLEAWGRTARGSPWISRLTGRSPAPGDLGSPEASGGFGWPPPQSQQSANLLANITGPAQSPTSGSWQDAVPGATSSAMTPRQLGWDELVGQGGGEWNVLGSGQGDQDDPWSGYYGNVGQQFEGMESGWPSPPSAEEFTNLGPFGQTGLRYGMESAGVPWRPWADAMLGAWRQTNQQAPTGLSGWAPRNVSQLGWDVSNPAGRAQMSNEAELFMPTGDWMEKQQRRWQPQQARVATAA